MSKPKFKSKYQTFKLANKHANFHQKVRPGTPKGRAAPIKLVTLAKNS